ncbi:MAG TPA: hypothetical protein PKE64_03100 [Anaerolineae bacterium]|nr:hypothetical protein [Anaerolineae bacterium]HMR62976.1 hypothetical protein [Anaerolineae bacterium]
MTVSLERPNGSKTRKSGKAKEQSNGMTYTLHIKKNGKRIEIIKLYCDCGRSIFVRADQDTEPVICGLCHGTFQWQQLMFDLG